MVARGNTRPSESACWSTYCNPRRVGIGCWDLYGQWCDLHQQWCIHPGHNTSTVPCWHHGQRLLMDPIPKRHEKSAQCEWPQTVIAPILLVPERKELGQTWCGRKMIYSDSVNLHARDAHHRQKTTQDDLPLYGCHLNFLYFIITCYILSSLFIYYSLLHKGFLGFWDLGFWPSKNQSHCTKKTLIGRSDHTRWNDTLIWDEAYSTKKMHIETN